MVLLVVCASCGATAGTDDDVAAVPAVTATSWEAWEDLGADWRQSYVDCARSVGIDARVSADGQGIDNASSPDREVADVGLDAGCVERVGLPPQSPQLTPEQLSGLYDLEVQRAGCLRDEGFPTSDPPSREVWVERYYSAPVWFSDEVVAASGGDVVGAMGVCPQPLARDVAP